MKSFFMVSLLVGFVAWDVQADEVIGQLLKNPQGKIQLKEAYSGKIYDLKQGSFSRYLSSFLGHETYLKFTGVVSGSEIQADRTPIIVSGPSKVEGVLTAAGNGYIVNNQRVAFNPSKKVNGTSFNSASIKSFLNKPVIANGTLVNGIFQVSAIIPGKLYAAGSDEKLFGVNGVHADFSKDPLHFVTETINENKHSQSTQSFRATLMGAGSSVKENDFALVLTLSGRQGDDYGAVNGHIGSGMARVKKDLSLDLEVYNYYPPKNEKMIIPGAVDVVDYFGNLVVGQNNYRPTYTVVIYGESEEKLLKLRNAMDEEFSKLRAGEDNFSVRHNCTTVTNDGLAAIGIVGKNKKFTKKTLSSMKLDSINPLTYAGDLQDIAKHLVDSVGKTPAQYFPRPAFESLIKNLDQLMQNKLNSFRVDYIFQAQTPSDRAIGGTAANELYETLKYSIQEQKHGKLPTSREKMLKSLNRVD